MDNGVGIDWEWGQAVWRGAKGENWDNYNNINYKIKKLRKKKTVI